MEEIIIHQEKTFSNIEYANTILRGREFIACVFKQCDFSNSDLRDNVFEDCTFESCNFSMVKLDGTSLRNIQFVASKVLGCDFSRCNKFMYSFAFTDCILDYSIFLGLKIRNTHFLRCSMKEVDFSQADLSMAIFDECDLSGAIFANTTLEKTDFRKAHNFRIQLENNKVKKAKFNSSNLSGLVLHYGLDLYD